MLRRAWVLAIFAASACAQNPELMEAAGKLGSTLTEKSYRSVAVLLPSNDQQYPIQFGNFIAGRLSIMLANRGFQVSSRQTVAETAAALQVSPERDDSRLLNKLKEQGAEAVIACSYQVLEENVTIDLQLIALGSGNIVGGHSLRIKRSPDVNLRLGSPAAAEIPAEAATATPAKPAEPPAFDFAAGAPPLPAAAPPPSDTDPKTASLAIPAGLPIHVRLIDTLSTKTHAVGATFQASLDQPFLVGGEAVAPKGADVSGVRFPCPENAAEDLCFTLTKLQAGGREIRIKTSGRRLRAKSSGSGRAKQAAGLGALGAIIGAAAGGGKGAAIGGAAGGTVGAATGGGAAVATVASETLLEFRTR